MIELSVVIASKNHPEALRRCLLALAKQKQPLPAFEVVVVDDGSTPPIASYVSRDQFSFDITMLRQDSVGQAAALNRGVEAARAPFCLLLDDDIEIEDHSIKEHLTAQLHAGVVIAVGHLAYEAFPEG